MVETLEMPDPDELGKLIELTLVYLAGQAHKQVELEKDLAQLEVALERKRHSSPDSSKKLDKSLNRIYKSLQRRMDQYGRINAKLNGIIRAKSERLRRLNSRSTGPQVFQRTVLQFDMQGYTPIAKIFEKQYSAVMAASLDKQIQDFASSALTAIGIPRSNTDYSDRGDGGRLIFDKAAKAFEFAEQFFRIVNESNRLASNKSTQHIFRRFFRMAAVTGDVAVRSDTKGALGSSGVSLIDVSRLETGGRAGELAIDTATFERLPPEQRARFEKKTFKMVAKHGDRFECRRCIFNADDANDAARQSRRFRDSDDK